MSQPTGGEQPKQVNQQFSDPALNAEAAQFSLDQNRLEADLVETGLLSRVVVLDTVDSTQTFLQREASGADFVQRWPQLSVVTAETQTAGHGRRGRQWTSPVGSSLSTSVVVHTNLPEQQRQWLGVLAGWALVTVLQEFGLAATLKWPNDVLVEERKIAGVVSSAVAEHPGVILVGCGINVTQRDGEHATAAATSVAEELAAVEASVTEASVAAPSPEVKASASDVLEAGPPVQLRALVLTRWLSRYANVVEQVHRSGDINAVFGELTQDIATIGQPVRVYLSDETQVQGHAVAVARSGALEVDVTAELRHSTAELHHSGDSAQESDWKAVTPYRRSFHVGDVVHLRPSNGVGIGSQDEANILD